MEYFAFERFCLCPMGGAVPEQAKKTAVPFAPLVFLLQLRSADAFGIRAVRELSETPEPLRAVAASQLALTAFVRANGACMVNTAYRNWLPVLRRTVEAKSEGLRLTVVGLGDVGGTLLTGLKLLAGKTVSEIGIYDPNDLLCERYEMELNQVLAYRDEPMPELHICGKRELFDGDAFLFTASRGVPPVGTQTADVRLEQFEKNREMLKEYSRLARESHFTGLFCQISDPVDLLTRAVCLQTNGDDFGGLLPEQLQGYGLGVMAARAAYVARRLGVDFSAGQVFGPHGAGLVAANAVDEAYDDALSQKLTAQTVDANLRVRACGFKPYIAPGLSSACVSVLQTLTGQWHYGAVPFGGVYFGCRSRMTCLGLETQRLTPPPQLLERLRESYAALKRRDAECRL